MNRNTSLWAAFVVMGGFAGTVQADTDLAGVLAAEVISEAISRAVRAAESAYGFPAAADLTF